MKKLLIYLAVTVGLSAILAVVSRFSTSFSEWYSMNIYRFFVGTVGRFFGFFSFSAGEFYLIFVLLVLLGGLVFAIVKTARSKGKRRRVLAISAVAASCIGATLFLQYMLLCGINYNRQAFLYIEHSTGEISFERTPEDELRVFLHMLAEFEEAFPDLENQITTDANGFFVKTSDVSETAPAAMANLAKAFPRLDVRFSQPKPVRLFAELMSDAFIIGIYWPYTLEANYNSIAPDSERGITALHELVHTAGFMRENEANFIAFLAARESGDAELMYSGYLFAFEMMIRNIADEFTAAAMREMLPGQMHRDRENQRNFWLGRLHSVDVVFDSEGEVIDTIVSENPVAGAIQDASSSMNDLFLRVQGQEGTVSYSRMIDLLYATELARIDSE